MLNFHFTICENAMQNWAASRPRLHIRVGALGALPTHMKNRADVGRAADPNKQKTDKYAVRLGRCVGVALSSTPWAAVGLPEVTAFECEATTIPSYPGEKLAGVKHASGR